MTIKKTYVCNFCSKQEVNPQSMRGVYFLASPIEAELREPATTENHLCPECAEAIWFAVDNDKRKAIKASRR